MKRGGHDAPEAVDRLRTILPADCGDVRTVGVTPSHRRIAARRRALERQLVGVALVERVDVADQPLIAGPGVKPDEMRQAGGPVDHETLRPSVVPGRVDVAHRAAADFPGPGMQAALDL